MENEEFATICKSCLQKGNSFHGQSDNNSVKTKCTQWLEKCETSEDTSSLNSSEYASASSKSVEQFGNCENQHVFDSQNAWCSSLIDSLEKIHETTEISKQDGSILGNININNSRKIHVGNVTYVTGPISFNQNVSLKKNCRTTNTILLQDLTDQIGKHSRSRKENTLVVHVNQTIHVKSKSWRQVFAGCLFKFMELCMQLVDGA